MNGRPGFWGRGLVGRVFSVRRVCMNGRTGFGARSEGIFCVRGVL